MKEKQKREEELRNYAIEASLCAESLAYFCHNYGHVQEGGGDWIRFELWPAQTQVCNDFDLNRFVVVLKARQLGLSWIAVHEALKTLLFKPGSKVGLFSLRENEAKDLLKRVKAVYNKLPEWMKPRGGIKVDAATEFQLDNGSRCMAFSTGSGDSYTFELVIVDEADLVPNLDRMLASAKPTIDAGGRLRLISRSNKSLPVSAFKRIFTSAIKKENSYKGIFLPWHSRPDRNQEWYDTQCKDSISTNGSLDYVREQYPASYAEALAPNELDKRIPLQWITQCYEETNGIGAVGPAINGLVIYKLPEKYRQYVAGADTAEGNVTSDDSCVTIMDLLTGEECAVLCGKFEPSTFAAHIRQLSRFYNTAKVLVERNNHGHAVLLSIQDDRLIPLLNGIDNKLGWMSTSKGNALLYSTCADAFRDKQTILHSFDTYSQLASLEGSTLAAPDQMHDDRADSYALALKACEIAAGVKWIPPEAIKPQEIPQVLPGTKPKSQGIFGISMDYTKKMFGLR